MFLVYPVFKASYAKHLLSCACLSPIHLPTYIDKKCCPCIKAFSFSIGLQCLYHSSFPTVNVSSAS